MSVFGSLYKLSSDREQHKTRISCPIIKEKKEKKMVVSEKEGVARGMNARVVGSGSETVILAHGFGGDQSLWDKMVPSLAQRCRVLVFDWTFSGAVTDPNLFDPAKYSSYDAFASDLIDLADELNLTCSVFVGHSMSAMIGCIASLRRPDLFKKLVLIAASPRYINSENYVGGFEISDIEQLISNIESNYQNWAAYFPTIAVDARDPESIDKFSKCLARMRPEVALSLAKTVFLSDHRDVLDKVVTPCTIVQTTSDVAVHNSVPYYIQDKVQAASTVEIMDTCGHFPQLTAHLQLLEVLRGVLDC